MGDAIALWFLRLCCPLCLCCFLCLCCGLLLRRVPIPGAPAPPRARAITSLAGLALAASLAGACASSTSKDAPDAGSRPGDGGLRASDAARGDLIRGDRSAADAGQTSPGDGRPRPEAFHFWDAGADRGGSPDSTPSPDTGSPPDSAPGADLPQGPDPGPVQCRNDGECGGAMTCNMSAPGGICSGCGTCKGWLECYAGSCVRDCYHDGECNAGFRCSSTDRCVLRACDAATPCPAPYTCGASGFCARPTCPAGSCPPPLICTGGWCLEP